MQIKKVVSFIFIMLFPCAFYCRCPEIPIVFIGKITDVNGKAIEYAEIELEYEYECVEGIQKDKVVLSSDALGQYRYSLNQRALEYIYWYGEPCLYDDIILTIRIHARGFKDSLSKHKINTCREWSLKLKDKFHDKGTKTPVTLKLIIYLDTICLEEN